jgi:hypothetical protein
MYEQEGCAKL